MRKTHSARWLEGLLGLSMLVSSAQGGTQQLLNFTHSWKYYDLGDLPPPQGGRLWTAPDYDDSAWASGPGALGFPTEENLLGYATVQTLLPRYLPGSVTQQITSYYFRTTFEWSGPTTNVILIASNLVDDGAVFYLNGKEIGRVAMPAGAVGPNTLALRSDDISERGPDVLWVYPATNQLQSGINTLAVEVHQGSATSSDLIFALSLTAQTLDPIQIVQDLVGTTVIEGQPLVLGVEVTGSSPWFQWYKDGQPFPGAPTNSGTFQTTATLEHAGDWWVVVGNYLGAVTSAVVRVEVLPDVYPPTLLRAYLDDAVNALIATFSEPLDPAAAANASNYVVQMLGTTRTVPVQRASHNAGLVTLFLGTANLYRGSNYVLTVLPAVTDPKGNPISPLSNQVLVALCQDLLSMEASWLYWDWITATYYRDPPVAWPTNWNQPDCDDTDHELWLPVTGIMHWAPAGGLVSCGSWGSLLPTTRGPRTHYFRTRFMAPETTGRTELNLIHVVASGAVFYLNGVELYRFNMPAGPVTSDTYALSSRSPACTWTPLVVTNLRNGENVLAVETHRSIDTDMSSSAVACGLRIRAPLLRPAPWAQIKWQGAYHLEVRGIGPGGVDLVLEGTTNLVAGPWVPLATNAPLVQEVTPNQSWFFRVRAQ